MAACHQSLHWSPGCQLPHRCSKCSPCTTTCRTNEQTGPPYSAAAAVPAAATAAAPVLGAVCVHWPGQNVAAAWAAAGTPTSHPSWEPELVWQLQCRQGDGNWMQDRRLSGRSNKRISRMAILLTNAIAPLLVSLWRWHIKRWIQRGSLLRRYQVPA